MIIEDILYGIMTATDFYCRHRYMHHSHTDWEDIPELLAYSVNYPILLTILIICFALILFSIFKIIQIILQERKSNKHNNNPLDNTDTDTISAPAVKAESDIQKAQCKLIK